jgi:hypothetical protein
VEGSNHFAVMLVSKDKKRAKLTTMRFLEKDGNICLYPRGLQADISYEIPELQQTMTGGEWMRQGIEPIFASGDYETCTYHFVAKKQMP